MFSINCEVSRDLNCSKNCAIVATNAATIFSITVTKLYILVVTLSTEDNAKLLEQLKSAFKRTISWNKYQTKVSTAKVNWYLDILSYPSFVGLNKLFVLTFKDGDKQQVTDDIIFQQKKWRIIILWLMGQTFLINQ